MTLLAVIIPGDPVAKGRPRAFTAVGGHTRMYTPKPTVRWESHAAFMMANAAQHRGYEGPVRVVVDACKSRPKSGGYPARKMDPDGECWRTKKPDADNVFKAVADALEKSGVIVNDKQIAEIRVRSLWASRGKPGSVSVMVEDLMVEGAP